MPRVFVSGGRRGGGGPRRLGRPAEGPARPLGAARLVLDTRADLTEARALYARLGYEETAPHNDDMYADHWFGKDLLNKDLLSTDLLS